MAAAVAYIHPVNIVIKINNITVVIVNSNNIIVVIINNRTVNKDWGVGLVR